MVISSHLSRRYQMAIPWNWWRDHLIGHSRIFHISSAERNIWTLFCRTLTTIPCGTRALHFSDWKVNRQLQVMHRRIIARATLEIWRWPASSKCRMSEGMKNRKRIRRLNDWQLIFQKVFEHYALLRSKKQQDYQMTRDKVSCRVQSESSERFAVLRGHSSNTVHCYSRGCRTMKAVEIWELPIDMVNHKDNNPSTPDVGNDTHDHQSIQDIRNYRDDHQRIADVDNYQGCVEQEARIPGRTFGLHMPLPLECKNHWCLIVRPGKTTASEHPCPHDRRRAGTVHRATGQVVDKRCNGQGNGR